MVSPRHGRDVDRSGVAAQVDHLFTPVEDAERGAELAPRAEKSRTDSSRTLSHPGATVPWTRLASQPGRAVASRDERDRLFHRRRSYVAHWWIPHVTRAGSAAPAAGRPARGRTGSPDEAGGVMHGQDSVMTPDDPGTLPGFGVSEANKCLENSVPRSIRLDSFLEQSNRKTKQNC